MFAGAGADIAPMHYAATAAGDVCTGARRCGCCRIAGAHDFATPRGPSLANLSGGEGGAVVAETLGQGGEADGAGLGLRVAPQLECDGKV